MDWYWILLILVVVILILWWALRRNAKATEVPTHHEDEITKQEDVSAVSQTKEAIIDMPDDLEIIEGIGPKIASVLKDYGIATFTQLAEEDPSHIKEILEKAGLRLADPTTWPEQAKLAASGDNERLKEFQERLKGGKVVK